jgi:S-DNA-T family DNA segregation ATPase FtsK/SpoIIIE
MASGAARSGTCRKCAARFLPGGLLGHLVSTGLLDAFNTVGANLVALAIFFVALFLTTKFSFIETHHTLRGPLSKLNFDRPAPGTLRHLARKARRASACAKRLERNQIAGAPADPRANRGRSGWQRRRRSDEREVEEPEEESERPRSIIFQNVEEKRKQPKPPSSRIAKGAASFRLPSPDLLRPAPRHEKIEEDELKECAHAIEQKCQEFDVGGRITQINPGPVVTTYELKPEAGIKYSRITGLADDLCLALKAESILIERIPGKSTVGIEVPNANRQTIALREQIESAEFVNSPSKMTLALGKDLIGRNRVSDLCADAAPAHCRFDRNGQERFPQLLILSMLYKARPTN